MRACTRRTGAALALALGAVAIPGAGPEIGAARAQTAPDAFAAAAFVDGRAITNFDVAQSARLLGLGREGTAPREAALESMIEARLKRSAAEAAGVELSREEVEQGLARFAAARGLDAAGLERALRAAGVSLEVARRVVETELMWNAYIARIYGPGTEVSDAELAAEIEARGLDRRVEYELGEISLPGASEAEAREVLDAYRGGTDFGTLARRLSRAPSARNGGRVGWVPRERLPPGLAEAVAGLAPGEATDPLPVPGGRVIIALFDRRSETVELDAEARERIRAGRRENRVARRAEGRLAELRAEAYVGRR